MTKDRKAAAAARLQAAQQRVQAQLRWISEHGGDRAGYIALYGSATDHDRTGDGGEAIYTADRAVLEDQLRDSVAALADLAAASAAR
jgi:hypothetical protein